MIALIVVAQLACVSAEERVVLTIDRNNADTCPSDDDFRERVRARIGSEPFADEGPRQLHLSLAREGAVLRARIDLSSTSGARFRRELTGPLDCTRLAEDVVLALAIAVDPLLLMRPKPTPPEPFKPPPPRESGPLSLGRRGDLDVVIVRPPFDPPIPITQAVRAAFGVSSFASQVPTPAVRAEVSLDYGALDMDGALRLDLPSTFFVTDTTRVRLSLFAAQLAPCFGAALDVVRVRACGIAEAGSIIVEGIGFVEDQSVSFPWVAFGGRGALDLPVTESSSLFFSGDLVAPIIRPRFVDSVPPRPLYHQPAPVALVVAFGVEARIR